MEYNHRNAVLYLNKLFLSDSVFDFNFILFLRLKVAAFIITYQTASICEVPLCALFDMDKFPSLIHFVYNDVMEMGVESGDLTLLLTPLVLRININIVLIDKKVQVSYL